MTSIERSNPISEFMAQREVLRKKIASVLLLSEIATSTEPAIIAVVGSGAHAELGRWAETCADEIAVIQAIHQGVAPISSDTAPGAIEVTDLLLKYAADGVERSRTAEISA